MVFVGIAGALVIFGAVFIALSLAVLGSARLCTWVHAHRPASALATWTRTAVAHRRSAPIVGLHLSRNGGPHPV